MEPSPPELMHSPHSSTPYRAPAESFRGVAGRAGEELEKTRKQELRGCCLIEPNGSCSSPNDHRGIEEWLSVLRLVSSVLGPLQPI